MPCSEIYFLQERVVIWVFEGNKVNDTGKDLLLRLTHHSVFVIFTHIELTINYWR